MPHLTRSARLALGLGIAALAGLGVTIAGAQSDETPRGTDPLAATELEVATDLARASGATESDRGLGDDDIILLVERHEADKAEEDGPRRADVYVYSYDDDVLTHTVVDVDAGTVESSTALTDAQLPLVAEEAERALDLALADPEAERLLATAYRQAAGRDLTDPATELEIQPIVFRADSRPGAGRAVAACGRHRCAQLMIQTSDHLLVEAMPIVDLSDERVISDTGVFS